MIRGTKRPRVKEVEIIEPKSNKVDANINAAIHNRFDIEVIDAATGNIKQRAQAENVICNQLWSRMFTPNTYFNYIHYGTGSGTPSSTDTSLFTFLGYGTPASADDKYTTDVKNGILSIQRKIQLSELMVIGSTLTEVGIGYSTTAATLCTHAMLKDMNGNQISIVKTSTDVINIYATVYVHFSSTGYDSGAITLTPPLDLSTINTINLFQWLIKGNTLADNTAGGTAFYIGFRRFGAACGSFNVAEGQLANFSLNLSEKTLKITMTRLDVNTKNTNGGYSCVQLYQGRLNYSVYMASLALLRLEAGAGWFPYSSITAEAIGTGDGATQDFATDYNYANDVTLYIDGVEKTSGVTISSSPHVVTDARYGFDLLSYQLHLDTVLTYISPYIRLPGSSYSSSGGFLGSKSVYYNKLYSYGVSVFSGARYSLECSEDLETWISMPPTVDGVLSIPSEYQHYKYWRFTATSDASPSYIEAITFATTPTPTNIHFDTPPASGAIITADYTTPTIAKDINHVFDLSITLTLSEYSA